MIHRLRFENFFSFSEVTEISFVMDSRGAPNDRSCQSPTTGERLSKIVAVIGANGAGKTNAIKTLSFLSWFISKSFFKDTAEEILIQPNYFTDDKTSRFDIEFEVKGRLFRYNLAANSSRIIREALYEKTSRLWSNIFVREWNEKQEEYDITLRNFGLPKRQAEIVKEKVSLISAANQFEIETASIICDFFSNTETNITAYGRHNFTGFSDVIQVSEHYRKNTKHRDHMAKLLREWDFGLKDVVIEVQKAVGHDGKEIEYSMPYGIHIRGETELKIPLLAESSGTQAAYYLLTKLLPVLENGGTVVYDELEGDLHPLMLEPILSLFISPKTNPHCAQIIFTTHSLEILNDLQKSQIVLVEKNDGISEAWRLSEMEGVRSDDNFYAKYMAGTYGAIPNI